MKILKLFVINICDPVKNLQYPVFVCFHFSVFLLDFTN